MKVVIDISQLHPAALKRGVGFYTRNLYQALKNLKDGNQYYLKKNKKDKFSPDLIHYPYFDPFFLTLPCCSNTPFVITIHDLIPLKFPQHYPAGIKGQVKWQLQKRLVKKAKAILTDSISSKKDISKLIGFSEEKIFPVYLAVEEKFKKIKDKRILVKIKKKYGLEDKFLLYVGDLNWNKNIPNLIKVITEIEKLDLVLVGSAFKNAKLEQLRGLKRLTRELRVEKRVKMLGFVEDKDLVAIYNLAVLYIQPSFYEGFGLPVLEAMSSGCPVLCSQVSSLPEVGSQSVAYFNPWQPEELANGIKRLMGDKEERQHLSKLGLKRAQDFSWEKTAVATRRVYEKVLT